MRKKLDPRTLPGAPTPQQLRDSLATTYHDYSRATIVVSADAESSGRVAFETIGVDSTSSTTISLHISPWEGQRVTVARLGTGAVTVDTVGSETINGSASTTLANQYDAKTFEAINGNYIET